MRMEQAGRGNGEPHKIFNAQFGPLGRTTMYMTRLNRQVGPFPVQASQLYARVSQLQVCKAKHTPTTQLCCAGASGTRSSVLYGAKGSAASCPPDAHADARKRRAGGLAGSGGEGAGSATTQGAFHC